MTASRIRTACAVVLLLLAVGREVANRLPAVALPIGVNHSEPALALRKTLAAASAGDRRRLGEVYEALALAVETGRLIQNTEQLMAGTSNALDLAFNGKKLVAGVDVGLEVDAVVEASIGGKASVSITDANRTAIVSGLREVAWACGR